VGFTAGLVWAWHDSHAAAASSLALRVALASVSGTLAMGALLVVMIRRLASIEADFRRVQVDVERRASTDPLTDLPNRAAFEAAMQVALSGAMLGRRPALVLVDLDGFKGVNDTRGHASGDRALIAIARALRDAARADDLVARIGGDEFAVLLRDGNFDTPPFIGARLEEAIDGLGIASDRSAGTFVGASVGWTLWQPGDDSVSMHGRADAALYARKAERKRAARRA
jgi:diguanylate cyclase (GGDEF)-like protein